MTISDIPFDDATNVSNIQFRLHPLDVGFDLRSEQMTIDLGDEATLRVSYPDEHGERRVVSGPREAVVRRLEGLGFRFKG